MKLGDKYMSNENWIGKEARKKKAEDHIKEIEKYAALTEASIKSSIIYPDNNGTKVVPGTAKETKIIVEDIDSVSAIYKYDNRRREEEPYNKICVLNFASYKNPGGAFLNGAIAQEEALCHESNLYPVISAFMDQFYNPNKKNLNKALYNNNLIYSPNVVFLKDYMLFCDVITAAAPNKKAAQKYCNVTSEEVNKIMKERIDHVLFAAYQNRVDTLILGAYGCGVFGNNPTDVAHIFNHYLQKKYKNIFSIVIFAIPKGRNDRNFDAFKNIFDGMNLS